MQTSPHHDFEIANCHTHCFTINHVPDDFARGIFFFHKLLPIRWIKKHGTIRWILKQLNKQWVISLLKKISPTTVKTLDRLRSFASFYEVESQQQMIDLLRGYYPSNTKFVLLTMDMEFMAGGKPIVLFKEQLDELAQIKSLPEYKDILYPFVFADPRRANVTSIVKQRIESGAFTGIKIYPALGYFPFDKRLKEVYEYEIEKDLPIITHCIRGAVYNRGSMKDIFRNQKTHPIATSQPFVNDRKNHFTANFTHPLNYECLLNKDILRKHWNDDKIDLSKLKMCLGHFGGNDEWMNYLCDPWLPVEGSGNNPLDIEHPWFNVVERQEIKSRAYSWFSVACELMNQYDNVYADISYTLSDDRIFPLLKLMLTSSHYEKISNKILFGTDFYVVSKAGAEREMSIKLRGYLGDQLFKKIAAENPKRFLGI
jgi:predicted TIM-barrel fold metal-dependent hydrolase